MIYCDLSYYHILILYIYDLFGHSLMPKSRNRIEQTQHSWQPWWVVGLRPQGRVGCFGASPGWMGSGAGPCTLLGRLGHWAKGVLCRFCSSRVSWNLKVTRWVEICSSFIGWVETVEIFIYIFKKRSDKPVDDIDLHSGTMAQVAAMAWPAVTPDQISWTATWAAESPWDKPWKEGWRLPDRYPRYNVQCTYDYGSKCLYNYRIYIYKAQ